MRTSGRTISMKGTSSPASWDRVSCTRAIERMRRTDSSTAALASGDDSRRPCRRSSDEMVCRLFFTRWWISRMVASFDSSRRSRRRSSEMSRSSTTRAGDAAVLEQRDAAHQHGDLRAPARSPRCRAAPWRTRCARPSPAGPARRGACPRCWRARRRGAAPRWRSARRTRPGAEPSSRITPSPTRGASSLEALLAGERELARRDHPGEAVEHLDVGALELAGMAHRRAPTPG